MTFPDIPQQAQGRAISGIQADTSATRTFPDLSGLTKNSGDLLIAIVAGYQTTAAGGAIWSGWSAGWTEFLDVGGSSNTAIGAAYKWSNGTETGTISVTQAGTITGQAAFVILSISTAHATSPPEGGTIGHNTAAAATPGTLDPAGWGTEDALWISVAAGGETGTAGAFAGIQNAPTNYGTAIISSISADVVGGINLGASFRQLNAASEASGGWTVDTSNARNSAVMIVVRGGVPNWAGNVAMTAPSTMAVGGTKTTSGAVAMTAPSTLVSNGTLPAAGNPATWVGTATFPNTSVQDVVINKPGGVVADDIMVLHIARWSSGTLAAPSVLPSGAISIGSSNIAAPANGGNIRSDVIVKRVAAETSWTTTYASAEWSDATALFFRGVPNTLNLSTLAIQFATATSATTAMPAPTITATDRAALAYFVNGADSSAAWTGTPPTGFTERRESDFDYAASKDDVTGGSTTISGGVNSTSQVMIAAAVNLPGVSGPTTYQGAVAMTAASTLVSNGTVSLPDTVTMTAPSTLTSAATKDTAGAVAMTAPCTLLSAAPPSFPFATSTSGRKILDQYSNPFFVSMYHQWNLIGWGGGRNETGVGTTTPHSAFDAVGSALKDNGINTLLVLSITSNQGGEVGPYQNGNTWDGVAPWSGGTPGNLNEAYWSRVDDLIDTMAGYGITVYLFLISSYTIATGTAFASMTAGQATTFGTNLANRYKNRPNIIWGFGADYFDSVPTQIQNICTALRAGGDNHLISLEFMAESGTYIKSEGNAAGTVPTQVDFADVYSYNAAALEVRRAYGATSKPVLFANGHYYQGGTADNKVMSDLMGWAFTSGSFGFFVGSEGTWQNNTGYLTNITGDAWPNTNYPAVRTALTGLANWHNLIPASGATFVTSSRGTDATAITSGGSGGSYDAADPQNDYITCAVTADGKLGVVYTPISRTGITVDTSKLVASYKVYWVDPHNGAVTSASVAGSYNTPGNNSAGNGGWYLVFEGYVSGAVAMTAPSTLTPNATVTSSAPTVINTLAQTSASGNASTSNPVSQSFVSNTTPGSLVVGAISQDSQGNVNYLQSVTDNGGNNYTVLTPIYDSTTGQIMTPFYGYITSASNVMTLTCATNPVAYWSVMAVELSGNFPAPPYFDKTTSNVATNTTAADNITSGTTSTLAQSNELVVGVAADDLNAAVISAGTGFTFGGRSAATHNYNVTVEHKTVSNTAGVAATFTGNLASRYIAAVLTYKLAGGGPATYQGTVSMSAPSSLAAVATKSNAGAVAMSAASVLVASTLGTAPGNAAMTAPSVLTVNGAIATGLPFVTAVHSSGRYFVDQYNNPILIKGDSPWIGFAAISTTDWETYCSTRASQGFNSLIIDAVAWNLLNGAGVPGSPDAYTNGVTYDGVHPFTGENIATPNETYWARVDAMISTAESYGLTCFVFAVDAYSFNSVGPEIFYGKSDAQMYAYGQFLGNRYKNRPNIVWMYGNDYQPDATRDSRMSNVISGIASTGDTHMYSMMGYYHLSYSWQYANWTNTNWYGVYTYPVQYDPMTISYNHAPTKPSVMIEAAYAGESYTNGNVPLTIRKQTAWSLSQAAAGDFMGTEDWWFKTGWASRLSRSEVTDVARIRSAIEAIQWWKLVPSTTFVTSGASTRLTATDSNPGAADWPAASDYASAAIASDGLQAVVYVPTQRAITINTALLSGTPSGVWVNATTGTITPAGTLTGSLTPPTTDDHILRITQNVIYSGSATMTAPSALSANAFRGLAALVAMSAASTLATAAVRTTDATVTMTAPSALATAGVVTRPAAVAMTAPSTLVSAAVRDTSGAVVMTAPSTLTSAAVPTRAAAAAMTAASTLSAAAAVTMTASVAMTAPSALAVAGVRTTSGAVAMTAASVLVSAGTATGATSAFMTASSILTVAGFKTTAGATNMTAPSALTVAGVRDTSGATAMTAASVLVVAAIRTALAQVSMTGPSTLSATERATMFAAVAMTAISTLVANATTSGGAPASPFKLWNGTTELPLSMKYWNGSTEVTLASYSIV